MHLLLSLKYVHVIIKFLVSFVPYFGKKGSAQSGCLVRCAVMKRKWPTEKMYRNVAVRIYLKMLNAY